jgi:hypothetical protein
LPDPLKRSYTNVKPGELLLDGSDDPLLLCSRSDWDSKLPEPIVR